jgi:hypothetical protein
MADGTSGRESVSVIDVPSFWTKIKIPPPAFSRSPSIGTFWAISVPPPDRQIIDFAEWTNGGLARLTDKKRGRDDALSGAKDR